MPYSKDSIPKGHTEFGGGPGMIDPMRRADRVLEPHEQLWEVYATNPAPPEVATGLTEEEMSLRAAQIELENDPQTAKIERP